MQSDSREEPTNFKRPRLNWTSDKGRVKHGSKPEVSTALT